MANIPFAGGITVPLYRLKYTLPLNSFLSPLRWMPDSYAAFSGAAVTLYRLRPNSITTYNVTNVGGTSGFYGNLMQTRGLNFGPLGAANAPQACRYGIPLPSGLLATGGNYSNVPGSNIPTWANFSGGSGIPVVARGKLAWWFSAEDSTFNEWNSLIFDDGSLVQGWFGPNLAYQFGQAFWQDFANNRVLGLYQPGATNGIQQTTFDNSGNISSVSLLSVASTGYSWLDSPSYSNPLLQSKILNWLLVGANNAGGVPLVTNGSPLFVMASDLSSFSEFVFTNGVGVDPNDEGGFGPPWDYPNLGEPLVTIDTNGVIYYAQNDPTNSFMRVYASVAPLGSGGIPLSVPVQNIPALPLPGCISGFGETCNEE